MPGRLTIAAATLVGALAQPMTARGEPPACSGDSTACGKQAFDAGIKAYQAGNYAEALRQFREAQRHKAHPVITFNLALAEAKTDRVLEAIAHLDEVIAAGATDLVAKARSERALAEARVATITVEATGRDVRLEVDGVAASGSPPSVRANPGEHTVRVIADGKLAVDRRVVVAPGEKLRLSVTREREIVSVGGSEGSGSAGSGPGPGPDRGGLAPTWVYVGAGLTAVLGGVTIWSGLDTQSSFNDYEEALAAGELTQSQADRAVDDGQSKESRTNILIGLTAAAGVTTAALAIFAVDWDSGSSAALRVTPGGAAVSGRF